MPKIVVRGRTFYYEDSGGSGEPLVFLSGLGGDHRAFNLTRRYFAARFRTLAVDARDAGRSDRCERPYTTADMADDVARWLQAIGVAGAHVVGQSLGGLVVQQLAMRYPQVVKSLVLISTHTAADAWRKAVIDSWVLLRQQLEIGAFTRAVLPWLVAPAFYRKQAQIDGLVLFAERSPWQQEAEAFARQAQAAVSHDSSEQIGQVRAPSLVVVGELDLVNPPRVASELASRLPGARMVVMPGVGHMPHVEAQVDLRLEIERFLDHRNA